MELDAAASFVFVVPSGLVRICTGRLPELSLVAGGVKRRLSLLNFSTAFAHLFKESLALSAMNFVIRLSARSYLPVPTRATASIILKRPAYAGYCCWASRLLGSSSA